MIKYSDITPIITGLTLEQMDNLSPDARTDHSAFDQAIKQKFNLPRTANTLGLYKIYHLRLIESSNSQIFEETLSDIEQGLFDVFSSRTQHSVNSVKVGDSVAVLELSTVNIPGVKLFARLQGSLKPKEIVKITKEDNHQKIHFADGDTYPKAEQDPLYLSQSWTMAKFFDTYEAASKPYILYQLEGKKNTNSLQFDIKVDTTQVNERRIELNRILELAKNL